MANNINSSPEIKEPTPKIQKLDQTPLFKVKNSPKTPSCLQEAHPPRSGLAWKHSIDVGAGVIDADYRGPVGVILFNHLDTEFEVNVGDRIAQLIVERIITPKVVEVDDLDSTVRGACGFGSTGV